MKENNIDPYSQVGGGLNLLQNLGTGRLIGVAGDDGSLLYYSQCQDCGCVVIDNHREPTPSITKYTCPICNPKQENFPFEYIPKDKISDSLQFRLDQGYY